MVRCSAARTGTVEMQVILTAVHACGIIRWFFGVLPVQVDTFLQLTRFMGTFCWQLPARPWACCTTLPYCTVLPVEVAVRLPDRGRWLDPPVADISVLAALPGRFAAMFDVPSR